MLLKSVPERTRIENFLSKRAPDMYMSHVAFWHFWACALAMSEQLWRELNQDACLSDCAQVPADERAQISKPDTRTRTGDPQLLEQANLTHQVLYRCAMPRMIARSARVEKQLRHGRRAALELGESPSRPFEHASENEGVAQMGASSD